MFGQKIKKYIILSVLAVIFLSICGFSQSTQRVYDYDDLYTDEEEAELEDLLFDTADDLECDMVIVTVSDYDGKDSQNFADDFYDEHHFASDADETGFLLLINMQERELYISNAGEAPSYFTDGMIDEMVSGIGSELASNDYMGAAKWFVNYVDENMWKKNYNESGIIGFLNAWWGQLIIAAAVSLIIVACLAHGNKTKMTVNSATYLKEHKNNVLQRTDQFIRTSTVSHKIESSSSSGGGSTHTSSGGHTHGGGGGKF